MNNGPTQNIEYDTLDAISQAAFDIAINYAKQCSEQNNTATNQVAILNLVNHLFSDGNKNLLSVKKNDETLVTILLANGFTEEKIADLIDAIKNPNPETADNITNAFLGTTIAEVSATGNGTSQPSGEPQRELPGLAGGISRYFNAQCAAGALDEAPQDPFMRVTFIDQKNPTKEEQLIEWLKANLPDYEELIQKGFMPFEFLDNQIDEETAAEYAIARVLKIDLKNGTDYVFDPAASPDFEFLPDSYGNAQYRAGLAELAFGQLFSGANNVFAGLRHENFESVVIKPDYIRISFSDKGDVQLTKNGASSTNPTDMALMALTDTMAAAGFADYKIKAEGDDLIKTATLFQARGLALDKDTQKRVNAELEKMKTDQERSNNMGLWMQAMGLAATGDNTKSPAAASTPLTPAA